MYFCIVLVIHHSEGVDSGSLGVYVFDWIGFSISLFFHSSSNHLSLFFIFLSCLLDMFSFDREAERSNILFRGDCLKGIEFVVA